MYYMNNLETRDFLETMFIKYCHPDFILNDPLVSLTFSQKKKILKLQLFFQQLLPGDKE